MEAVEFLKEYNRMCDNQDNCDECNYFDELNKYKIINNEDDFDCDNCRIITLDTPEFSVKYVEQWSKEHPKKTRLQDLLEKYPNTPLNIYGTPDFCPENIGMIKCNNCTHRQKECWNQHLEG